MRAAILHEVGQTPSVGDFDEPDGDVIRVSLAGCNPVDLELASGAMGQPSTPSVVGKEGIGVTAKGERVYFDSPPDPYGSWAELCRIDSAKTFQVPAEVDDALAVSLGIAGLAAWLPLSRHADVTGGKSVLVLGATGVVGHIAVQAAKLLGAGKVVGAGRNRDALEEVSRLGADATVVLGQGDDAAALKSEADGGYDVVIDTVYGKPFLAALEATAVGGTLVTIGLGAGASADVSFRALMGRTHVGHFNDAMPIDVVRAAYDELMRHAAQGHFQVETRTYGLDEAAEAWRAQESGPHAKLAIVP